MLLMPAELIRGNGHAEMVAHGLRAPENLQVAKMEKIESPIRNDFNHIDFHPPRCGAPTLPRAAPEANHSLQTAPTG
jgi:hypothetical protein